MEDGISAGGTLRGDNDVGEAPYVEKIVVSLLFSRQFNLAIGGPRRPRGLDKLVLNSWVKLMKWDHPPMEATAPGSDAAQSIINH